MIGSSIAVALKSRGQPHYPVMKIKSAADHSQGKPGAIKQLLGLIGALGAS
jgi:hypothetical protein